MYKTRNTHLGRIGKINVTAVNNIGTQQPKLNIPKINNEWNQTKCSKVLKELTFIIMIPPMLTDYVGMTRQFDSRIFIQFCISTQSKLMTTKNDLQSYSLISLYNQQLQPNWRKSTTCITYSHIQTLLPLSTTVIWRLQEITRISYSNKNAIVHHQPQRNDENWKMMKVKAYGL